MILPGGRDWNFLDFLFVFFFQAFREVFEHLIDDFKTYRPILSAIKSEYENLIEFQKEKIRELEPLQVKRTVIFCSLHNLQLRDA